jgi:hypothetical protein
MAVRDRSVTLHRRAEIVPHAPNFRQRVTNHARCGQSGAGYAGRVDIPIACSLTPAGARSQLDEWRALLAAAVTGTERPGPAVLSLRLRDDPGQLAAVVALAQREKACCPFFGFALEIGADSVALQVSVPPDAVSILDGFAQLI